MSRHHMQDPPPSPWVNPNAMKERVIKHKHFALLPAQRMRTNLDAGCSAAAIQAEVYRQPCILRGLVEGDPR
eukprot:CAMPEP_0168491366 /NCGR_PEP_ID=MMETSP0228-20121227/69658_1 /TAXON_ID=133427 /ORGANISM="Protoceratium reticulatum, Strain CCCM 535 (=CCMP 1889)" /LENGTH=71 /DNA_ID=CAMNT_0008508099 /DNA_START=414 /DNA_END=625 /DNA_ORIENTATION=-